MSSDERYLQQIRAVHPNLSLDRVRRLHGQFNDALIVNDELVFRFPRSPHAAAMLRQETAVLRAIRPFITMPIPEPEYGDPTLDEPFAGYRMVPGEPLTRQALADIRDEDERQRIADQLASFLGELHAIPLDRLGPELPRRDGYERWVTMYADVRDQLFPFMRPDARQDVARHFESYLAEPERLSFKPALRHGDFGAGNILWDPQSITITGVIDFSFAGVGDPAIDAAAISTFGEPFLERMFPCYPELATMLDRVRFYCGTYALTEALDGLRDGQPENFESGIRAYR
jgi:aminoglycoside 2''-phosphotransferase